MTPTAQPRYVYAAGPLGFSVPTVDFHRCVLVPALRALGAEVLDPWEESADLFARAFALPTGSESDTAVREANRLAGAANTRLIDRADAVFAVLDGVDVDSGTAAEIGYAAALGKPVVGWRSDIRQAGDNPQAVVNLQVEHFVRLHGGSLHADLAGALRALDGLLLGLPG